MSEPQKMFASVSGAFVAHVVLLLLVIVLPRADSAGAFKGHAEGGGNVREVTVMMADLMERLERERLAEATEPDLPPARPFASTDANRPETVAPEQARYESDRNTSAASRLRPDESQPQRDAPTLAGDSPLPHLTLANREFVDGPLGQDAVGSPPAAPLAVRAPPATSAGGAASPPTPGADPADSEAKRGDGSVPLAKPSARSFALPSEEGETSTEDEAAAAVADGLGTSPSDPVDSPTGPDAMAADAPPGEPAEADAMAAADSPPAPNPADEGLFSEGFSPEERQNVINGSLAKPGADAVDAEATPMGRYKKAVRDAISAKWHRYRQDNADFVTWGMLKIEFTVDASGRVRGLEITKNEANAMLAEFSLRAIRDAKLPPMPIEVASSVGDSGLVIQYDIIIY